MELKSFVKAPTTQVYLVRKFSWIVSGTSLHILFSTEIKKRAENMDFRGFFVDSA
jgi:hypothetical protein